MMHQRKAAVTKASTTVVTMFLLPGKETAVADPTMAGIDTWDGTDQLTGIEIMDNIGEPRWAIADSHLGDGLPGDGIDGDTERIAQITETRVSSRVLSRI